MPRRSRQQVRCCVSTTVSTKAACLTALLLLSECQGSAALPQRPHRLPGSVSHRPHFRSHTLALSSVVRSTKRRLKPSSEWPMASCSGDHHDPNVGRARAQYPDRPWVEGLPDAPKARHRAFMHRMVKFIKARDTAGALLLYDAAEELGCPLSEHVYSAVLSLCADGATVGRSSILNTVVSSCQGHQLCCCHVTATSLLKIALYLCRQRSLFTRPIGWHSRCRRFLEDRLIMCPSTRRTSTPEIQNWPSGC